MTKMCLPSSHATSIALREQSLGYMTYGFSGERESLSGKSTWKPFKVSFEFQGFRKVP